MSFRVYNTLSRSVEPFVPLRAGEVGLYTCGPTVYNFAHIGNYRAYVFEDVLRRHLRASGFKVTQVMNLTDVDDKTIRASRAEGVPLRDYTLRYKDAFFQDLRTLRVEPAEVYPAATDHVPEMIELIQTLLDKGVAYRSDDGSIYFSIDRFPEYGKLAHLDREGMKAGARVAQDEYEKESAADFALWKAWDEADGDVAWDSPWGRGRPGWHIECSAMSMKYLGPSFDLHTGGVDNIFPHHEDEIAQSEAVTGKPFVRYWMHCAHLVVDGKKMSKSLGNFHTLRDVLERGYSGRETRYVLLATHYRQSLNFTFEGLQAARAALKRLDAFSRRLEETAGASEPGAPPGWAAEGEGRFREAMDDDLNVSAALAALFDTVHAGNQAFDRGEVTAEQAAAAMRTFARIDAVLGLLEGERAEVPEDVLRLVEQRQDARKRKDWAESDRLRDALLDKGWQVKDTPKGPELTPVKP